MRKLSKSKLIAFQQCPKRLWLSIYHPERAQISETTQAQFNIGYAVGDLAHTIFDPQQKGRIFNVMQEGVVPILEQTQTLLQGHQPIFEAGIATDAALAFVDVLLPVRKKSGTKWKMIEVKSSTSVKDYHLEDVAIQATIARQIGIPLDSIYVAHIDKHWEYQGDGNYEGLLTLADVTEETLARQKDVEACIHDAHIMLERTSAPRIAVGEQCSEPFACEFYTYCTRKQQSISVEFPVQWLPNIRTNALKNYIQEQAVTDLGNVPDDLLNAEQLRVKQVTLAQKLYFDKKSARAQLDQGALPAYFLDFETINLAIPRWKKTRPYQQIVFQFSLHHLDAQGRLSHTEFLDVSGADPSLALAKALIAQTSGTEPIFVYNKAFESGRIQDLATRYPRLKKGLLAIDARLVDLLPIVRAHYYHPSQQGSWSIKAVLPAMFPEIRYDDLELVQDGTSAMAAYAEAIDPETDSHRKESIRQALLTYCALDTLAMVKIWHYLLGKTLKGEM